LTLPGTSVYHSSIMRLPPLKVALRNNTMTAYLTAKRAIDSENGRSKTNTQKRQSGLPSASE
jgi:hypothetical protein